MKHNRHLQLVGDFCLSHRHRTVPQSHNSGNFLGGNHSLDCDDPGGRFALVIGGDHLNFFAQDPAFGIEFLYRQFDGLHVDFAGSEITG